MAPKTFSAVPHLPDENLLTASSSTASASHEIRTPLHHLQGYSDLLAQTQLTEEGRNLLYAIQHATKTLSLSKDHVALIRRT